MSEFYSYFKENMEALNLTPPPESLFATQALAVATINTFVAFIDKFGTRVTVMDVIGAGTRLEQLSVVGAMGAAYYTGALIGSLAVATGRTLAGGTSLGDVLLETLEWRVGRPWLTELLQHRPEIYDPSMPGRKYHRTYRYMR
jgi:hypothetical protein